MSDIVWVCDGGSNLLKALEKCTVVRCMAHRLNNWLQAIFFQTETKTMKKKILFPGHFDEKSDDENDLVSDADTDGNQSDDAAEEQINIEEKRPITATSTRQNRKDVVSIISQLPLEARRILVTIIDCKELVQYVKKVSILLYDYLHH